MSIVTVAAARRLRGTIAVPGDKSISHRAVLFNSLAVGEATITHFLPGADCRSTIGCMRALGVQIDHQGDRVHVQGRGLRGLIEASDVLDCGNSGTTLRLLSGILAGIDGMYAVLTGDASLRSRPQKRIVGPLRALGAQLDGRRNGDLAPLMIRGARLHGGSYELPIASAQVKSALLLAALSGDGPLTLTGRTDGRDHSERMLRAMGADLVTEGAMVRLTPPSDQRELTALSLEVPGDPSSAAFWWVAAAIHPDAELTTTGVCLNPTRIGALEVLQAMGADLTISNQRVVGSEPVGDVTVRSSNLRGSQIGGAIIPRLIDEIPVLAVAAALAHGDTLVRDAQELRAKETDRIATVATGLEGMGATIEPTADGMGITGGQHLRGTNLDSHGDHRLAMAWAIAGLVAHGDVRISGADAVDVSYPGFWETLESIRA
ncbi:MAG: 3-phosphoshikimate 1-carboxyvinyltransferase [Roseiflexaceae bacterium]